MPHLFQVMTLDESVGVGATLPGRGSRSGVEGCTGQAWGRLLPHGFRGCVPL